MKINDLKEFIKNETVVNTQVLHNSILKLIKVTDSDEEISINLSGNILYYWFDINGVSLGQQKMSISDIITYIKNNKINKDDYESAILNCIKADIANKIITT